MRVDLINYTPDAEKVCARCASVSWKRKRVGHMTIGEAREIIGRVLSFGHESVIEHANFTFIIEGISRSMTHQLVRHRIASYTQQSMRYVDLTKSKDYFIVPETIKEDGDLHHQFVEAMNRLKDFYNHLVALGIPPQDARFVLPIASQTKIAVTMNARELRHFFQLRCCLRAQWEIRAVAEEMLEVCKKVAPSLFEKAGASCVRLGFCPEGKLNCGKIKEVRAKWI